MLSSVCRHLAGCGDLMNCTGGEKVQTFLFPMLTIFPAGSLVQFWTKIIQYYCFVVFCEKNCTAQEFSALILHSLRWFNSSFFEGNLMNRDFTVFQPNLMK